MRTKLIVVTSRRFKLIVCYLTQVRSAGRGRKSQLDSMDRRKKGGSSDAEGSPKFLVSCNKQFTDVILVRNSLFVVRSVC